MSKWNNSSIFIFQMEHCHPNISYWTLHGLWCVYLCFVLLNKGVLFFISQIDQGNGFNSCFHNLFFPSPVSQ